MSRFFVSEEVFEDQLLVRLEDGLTGSEAAIIPTMGSNLMYLKLPAAGGAVEVMNDLPHLADLFDQPNRFGTPILFPWPGEIHDGVGVINGRECNVAAADGTSHHGFVNRLPWRLVDIGSDEISCWATTEITSLETGELSGEYHFEFRLRLNFVLSGKGLQIQVGVANLGDEPMPFGFGAHPFFRVPFETSSGKRGDCSIKLDAAGQWQLGPLNEPETSLQDEVALLDREGFDSPTSLVLGNDMLNHVYQLRAGESGEFVTELRDPGAGMRVRVTSTDGFRTVVLYTPQNRDVVAIEPWTCPPNVFNLDHALMTESDDQELESDLITVSPGGRWDGEIRIELLASEAAG